MRTPCSIVPDERALMRRRPLWRKTCVLVLLTAAVCGVYVLYGLDFSRERVLRYSLSLRIPKLFAMLIVAFSIGTGSLIFQSVIRNRIVTPCLLGMDALYTLIHTMVYVLLGPASLFVRNTNMAFLLDLALMGVVATLVYGKMFEATHYHVFYVLLIGTVLTSLFGSIQTTVIRVMDPNEEDRTTLMVRRSPLSWFLS